MRRPLSKIYFVYKTRKIFGLYFNTFDKNTLRRELDPLEKILDHHPKVLLTLDEIPLTANYDGIRQLNIVDWLLRKSDIK